MVFLNFNIFVLGFFATGVVAVPTPKPTILEHLEAANERRECKLLKDCHFYQQFYLKQITDSLRQVVRKDIKQHACGLNAYMEVEKGILVEYDNIA